MNELNLKTLTHFKLRKTLEFTVIADHYEITHLINKK